MPFLADQWTALLKNPLSGLILRLFFSLLLLFSVLRSIDFVVLNGIIAAVHPLWFVLSVLCLLLYDIFASFRWKLILNAFACDASFLVLLRYHMLSVSVGALLPTTVGGDFARAYLAASKGRGGLRAALTVVLDRLTGLFSLLFLAALGFILEGYKLFGHLFAYSFAFLMFSLVIISFVCLSSAVLRRLFPLIWHFFVIFRLVSSSSPSQKVPPISYSFAFWPFAFAQLVGVLAHFLVVLEHWFLVISLSSSVDLGHLFWIVPAVWLFTLVPVGVNGIGTRELGMAFFLGAIGETREIAVALGFLVTISNFLTAIIGGVFYVIPLDGEIRPLSSKS